MPLTSLLLLVALALAVIPLSRESSGAQAVPAVAPISGEELVPTDAIEKQPSEEAAPDALDPELVSALGGSYVLQPVRVVSLTLPHDPT